MPVKGSGPPRSGGGAGRTKQCTSAGRAGELDELLPGLQGMARRERRKLGRVTALEQLRADLALAQRAYLVDQQAGCAAAMYAMQHLCWSRGLQDLVTPFLTLALGLEALRSGLAPSVFRKAPRPRETGARKPPEHLNLILTACVYLEALIETGMNPEETARKVAEVLKLRGLSLGRVGTPTWRTLIGMREDLRRGKYGAAARDQFIGEVRGTRDDLGSIPHTDPRAVLLMTLTEILGQGGPFPEKP